MEDINAGLNLILSGLWKTVELPEAEDSVRNLVAIYKLWCGRNIHYIFLALLPIMLKFYIFEFLLPSYQFCIQFFRNKKIKRKNEVKREEKPKPVEVKPKVLESFKQASDYFSAEAPKCQCYIWVQNDLDKWEVNGCGWRYENYIITAHHVYEGFDKIGISAAASDMYVVDFEPIYVQDDVAILRVPTSLFSVVPLSQANVGDAIDRYVRIHGPAKNNNASTGVLQETAVFGTVEYTGSTAPGYSGAPYMVGNNLVVGMHVSGGQRNIGFASEYIECLIDTFPEAKGKSKKKRRGGRRKSDWYNEDITSGTKIKARRAPNMEDWVVNVNGNYYTMDEEEFDKFSSHVKSRGGKFETMDRASAQGYYAESKVIKFTKQERDSLKAPVELVEEPKEEKKLESAVVVETQETAGTSEQFFRLEPSNTPGGFEGCYAFLELRAQMTELQRSMQWLIQSRSYSDTESQISEPPKKLKKKRKKASKSIQKSVELLPQDATHPQTQN